MNSAHSFKILSWISDRSFYPGDQKVSADDDDDDAVLRF